MAGTTAIPVHAGTPDDSYTIERYYAEAESQNSTTSTAFVNAVTLTFQPVTNKNYLVLASALTSNNSTSYYTETQLQIDSANYSITQHQPMGSTADYWRSFGTQKVVALASSSAHTIRLQFHSSNAAGTAYIRNMRIAVIELSSYENTEANSANSTTSTAYVNAAKLTFTPGTTANYVIFSTANEMSSSATKDAFLQLTEDGTSAGEMQTPGMNYMSYGGVRQTNLDTTAHTYQLQYKADPTSSTATVKDARITAVLAPTLGTTSYVAVPTENSTQSATFVNMAVLNFTPSARGDYLIVAQTLAKQENTAYAVYAKLDVDGTDLGQYAFRPADKATYRSAFWVTKQNLTAAAHSITVQFRTTNASASSEAFLKNTNIIAIRLNTAESYSDSGHTTVDDSFTSGQDYVYIWSHGLQASTGYKVAYYDAGSSGGQYIGVDSGLTSDAYGTLSSQFLLSTNTTATAGSWKAAVFYSTATPPSDYNSVAGTTGFVVADTFTVEASAIPEFPAVIAAITVAGTCFAIYYLMRKKRRLAYVKA